MKTQQTVTSNTRDGKPHHVKSKRKFGRLAALTALAGLCFGPSIQKSSAIILNDGSYAPLQKGLFNIVNLQNGEAVDNNSSTTVGTGVVLKARNLYEARQRWYFAQNSDDKTWSIVNAANGQALDDGNTSANNAQTIQYTANSANNNQRWYVDLLSDGNYKITNKASGKVLDSGNTSGEGIPLIQYTPNGGSQQVWKIYQTAS